MLLLGFDIIQPFTDELPLMIADVCPCPCRFACPPSPGDGCGSGVDDPEKKRVNYSRIATVYWSSSWAGTLRLTYDAYRLELFICFLLKYNLE